MREQEKKLYHLPIERVRETEMELRGAFVNVLFKVILPKLGEEFEKVKKVTTPSHTERSDDKIRMVFYATPVSDPLITFLPSQLVDRMAFGLDLTLANTSVTLERRRVIIKNFLQTCQEVFGLESVKKSRYFKYLE